MKQIEQKAKIETPKEEEGKRNQESIINKGRNHVEITK